MTTLEVDNGKYTIVIADNGVVSVSRYDEPGWLVNPLGSKMLIAMVHELADLRKESPRTKLIEKIDNFFGEVVVELADVINSVNGCTAREGSLPCLTCKAEAFDKIAVLIEKWRKK